MKERPILFSAPMVLAILNGTKTQTRRVLKAQPIDIIAFEGALAGKQWICLEQREPEPKGRIFRCRFGVAGDRLWVRETWYCDHYLVQRGGGFKEVDGAKDLLYYRATDCDAHGQCYTGFSGETMNPPWNPSIHMPRWASRITLEIAGVRVERLQDMSEADAKAEGLMRLGDGWRGSLRLPWFASPIGAYRSLWEDINGAGSWDANPWVWVVDFNPVAL